VSALFVLGDSLTVGTLVYGSPRFLPAAAAAAGIALRPAPSAKVGRRVDEGLAILAAQRHLPDAVLVALGTNDLLEATRASAASWIRRARALIGPGRDLFWVDLKLTGGRFARQAGINAGLRDGVRADNAAAAAAGWHGRSYVLAWNAFATDQGIRNCSDGIHYGVAQYALRAKFYLDTLAGSPSVQRYLVA
jgi:lysophospholipase L1-like esterase